ncbi:hypothetical protein SEA_LIGMA_32 [Gordonia phage Ligma]|nr:hypothetical protein SEA_LIGMA_32 [Gordonia phage Ligma]UQT02133.1 hypothetical protein SEA_AXUMITE_32 [Gordonia phage Axumite]
MFDPPSGEADLEGDVADTADAPTRYRDLEVGKLNFTVSARRPSPRSCHAISMAANAKIGTGAQMDHLTLFVRHHLTDESYESILHGILIEELPADALTEVARALATWGTARPTRR